MRIVITGGRDYKVTDSDLERLFEIIAYEMGEHADIEIIHGGARGVDTDVAREIKLADSTIKITPMRASWLRYGRSRAGFIRNQAMIDIGDMLIAFPGGNGTADCVKRARTKGIRIEYI